MSKKKVKDTAIKAVKVKKESKSFIIWDTPEIAETVIMSIIAAAFIAGSLFLYFYDFGFSADMTASFKEFFGSSADMVVLAKSFGAPLLICAISYLLFFSYRILDMDDRKWLKALLTLIYVFVTAGILYLNWYYCEKLFSLIPDSQIWRYIMWANSVSCGVFFLPYYLILVLVREWSKPWDVIITLLMMTFLPVILIIGFAVVSIGAVVTAITLPGKLIQKSVDSDLASRSSDYRGQAYTMRNESGYEETVYSTNGSDFYGSDGSYKGHKD